MALALGIGHYHDPVDDDGAGRRLKKHSDHPSPTVASVPGTDVGVCWRMFDAASRQARAAHATKNGSVGHLRTGWHGVDWVYILPAGFWSGSGLAG